MKKIILHSQLSILNLLLLCTALNAQDNKHEFSIYAGGGISTLNYKVQIGEQKMGFGGHAGLGYQFFFSPNWGIGTGAEFALYNSKFNINTLNTSAMANDIETGELFLFSSTVNKYEEKQTAGMLQIPLMLQYQTTGEHKFYIAAGGKVGLPVTKSYKSTANLLNSGYFAYESYTYTQQEFLGFGTVNGRESKGDMDLKMSFLASAEAGMKWRLSDGMSLYTGAYVDYGLNNVRANNNSPQPFVQYNGTSPRDFHLNSVIHAKYTPQGTGLDFTDKLSPFAVGIKLRLAFGLGAKKEIQPAPVPFTPVVDPDAEAARKAAEAKRLADEEAARKAAEAKRIADEEAARLAAEKAALQALKAQIAQPVDHYALGQTALSAKQKAELDKTIALLKENPEMDVFIYGHTCEIGGDKVNERVGLGRANNAKAYMISKGIEAKRIAGTASKLDREPIAPNTNEANRKLNRRVVVAVQ